MKPIKIWIGTNPDMSRLVQEWLFDHGCEWIGGSRVVKNEFSSALFVDEFGSITETSCRKFFEAHQCKNAVRVKPTDFTTEPVFLSGVDKDWFKNWYKK